MDRLIEQFTAHLGAPDPTHVVRAPGRVNLIGEHVDYNGLPVLPMALERAITIVARVRHDGRVRFAGTDPRFPERAFPLSPTVEPYATGDWGNYVKAAATGVAARYGATTGVDALVMSDLPIAAGLSSSSALVVAVALCLLHANGITFEVLELAEMLAEAERYVGTRGGGMDQAICLGAEPEAACKIEFSPLRFTAIRIPSDWRFVIAFSLATAEKSGRAQELYNRRTHECRDALHLVAARLASDGGMQSYPTLLARADAAQLLEIARGVLEPDLLKRFRHVVTEAERVDRAVEALRSADRELFGRLMIGSHRSLREDYEVSTASLDEITDIALDAGADGARLTGAGMGGCAVALCTTATANAVIDRLAETFYATRPYDGALADHLFVASPSAGAAVTALR